MARRSLYEIAVSMTMINHASPVLNAIAHQLLGIHGHINAATAASNRFRVALAGAGTALVGSGLLMGMAKIVDHGGEFLRITNQMKLQAWPKEMLQAAVGNAFTLSRRYPSIAAAEILGMTKEMAPVLGDRAEAIHISENMVKLMRSLQMQFGAGHAAQFHKQIRDAVRAGELSANVLRHERFDHFINIMARSLNAFGGTLTPSDFMQAFKYSRAAGLNFSDRFVAEVLPTIMQELGGSSAGTSFMTAYQAVIGGRMRLRSLRAFEALGLVDRSKIDTDNLTAEGRIKRMQPGLLLGSGLFMTDPDVWVQRFLVPALIKKGHITKEGYDLIRAGDLRSPLAEQTRKAITAQIALLWQDRTGQQQMDLLALQVKKILRDSKLLRQAYDLRRTEDVILGDYTMAKSGIRAQFENLNAALALPNMETATAALNTISAGLGKLTDTVRRVKPSTISAVFIGAAAGLTTLVGAATITILGALVGWPAVLGAAVVGALAGAATYVYHRRSEIIARWQNATSEDWRKATAAAIDKMFGDPLRLVAAVGKHLFDWPLLMADKFGASIRKIPDLLAPAITGMAQAIVDKIKGAFAGIGSWLGSLVPRIGGSGAPSAPSMPSPDDLMQPQSWVPPPRQTNVIPIRHVLAIDGQKLGEAVAYYVAKGATHVQSAAQYDGGMSHVPVDMQFA